MLAILLRMDQGSSWRWLVDWQEASKKPVRTLLFMFAAAAVGAGAFTYYVATNRSFPLSLAVGLGCGVDEGPIYGAGRYTLTKLGLFSETKTAAAGLAIR